MFNFQYDIGINRIQDARLVLPKTQVNTSFCSSDKKIRCTSNLQLFNVIHIKLVAVVSESSSTSSPIVALNQSQKIKINLFWYNHTSDKYTKFLYRLCFMSVIAVKSSQCLSFSRIYNSIMNTVDNQCEPQIVTAIYQFKNKVLLQNTDEKCSMDFVRS